MTGRHAWTAVGLALAVLPLCACKSRLAHAPVGRYERDGLSFDHAAGWTVEKDKETPGSRMVAVGGPEHAALSISIFTPDVRISLETFAREAVKARGERFKEKLASKGLNQGAETATMPLAPIERPIAGKNVAGLQEHSVFTVVNVPMPTTIEFFLVDVAGRQVFLMDQAADEDRPKVQAGIQEIFDSIALRP